jgi:hypothetical protein
MDKRVIHLTHMFYVSVDPKLYDYDADKGGHHRMPLQGGHQSSTTTCTTTR